MAGAVAEAGGVRAAGGGGRPERGAWEAMARWSEGRRGGRRRRRGGRRDGAVVGGTATVAEGRASPERGREEEDDARVKELADLGRFPVLTAQNRPLAPVDVTNRC